MKYHLILVMIGLVGFFPAFASAAGKKPTRPVTHTATTPSVGKHVIRLDEVGNAQIELPDQSQIDFGESFGAILRTGLSQNFIVEDYTTNGQAPPSPTVGTLNQGLTLPFADSPSLGCYGIHWERSQTPVSQLRFQVNAMSFQTGTGGERMFYGFNERFRTPYNNGSLNEPANEFPLRQQLVEPNYFDRTFDDRGTAPLDSRSGLDLGDGINVNVLFAWLAVKYAQYTSSLHLQMDRIDTWTGQTVSQVFKVSGGGYFYDVVGAYDQYSAGIKIARTDAMSQAMNDALNAAYNAIESDVSQLPLVAKIDGLIQAGTVDAQPLILLGTGYFAGVPSGTQYSPMGRPDLILQTDSNCADGSTARLIQGDWNSLQPGMLVAETSAVLQGVTPSEPGGGGVAGTEQSLVPVEIPLKNLDPSPNLNASNTPQVSLAEAFLKSLVETVMLPYRLARYWAYDQTYHKSSDSIFGTGTDQTDLARMGAGGDDSVDEDSVPVNDDSDSEPVLSPEIWSQQARATSWATQIGFDSAPEMANAPHAPIVAILDSGVDYNHPVIHDALWLNSKPTVDLDGLQDRYGWDFISGDSRPYDDSYHGSEVASTVLAVAPKTQIMALKVFNPYGITSSAAIFGAFQYAVDHGATLIVAAWAARTDGPSQALADGIQYARSHGVLVVAAAGDRGHDLSQESAYPAVFSPQYDNLIIATGVTSSDQLVQTYSKMANYSNQFVTIAAPGDSIHVADPRAQFSDQTSTSYSAALVAGALARLNAQRQMDGLAVDAASLKDALLSDADEIPALQSAVSGGKRLHIRK